MLSPFLDICHRPSIGAVLLPLRGPDAVRELSITCNVSLMLARVEHATIINASTKQMAELLGMTYTLGRVSASHVLRGFSLLSQLNQKHT